MNQAKSIFWKLYAALLSISYVASFFTDPVNTQTLLPALFSGIGIVGMVGFALNRPFGPRILWRIYFGLLILVIGLLLGYVGLFVLIEVNPADTLLLLLAFILCILPLWYALWSYAYKSPHIWRKRHNKTSNLTSAENAPPS